MKKISSSLSILFFLALTFGFASCKEDLCDKKNCAYSGVCDQGNCICQVGYEGLNCEIIAREKFVDGGVYRVNETGTITPQAIYTAIIANGARINEVRLKNLRNGVLMGGEVIGTVSHDTIQIARQIVNGFEIEGFGIISGKNPVDGGNLYQDASIQLTYKTTRLSDNTVDYYGTNGSSPSEWNKN